MTFDLFWKNLIAEVTEEFLRFFLPQLHAHIDTQGQVELLQQELFFDKKEHQSGIQRVDLLLKIPLKGGTHTICLLHAEAETSPDADFVKRMFMYYAMLMMKYDLPIVALALFTGRKQKDYPSVYNVEFFGTSLTYQFNTFDMYSRSDEELLSANSPIADAVLCLKRHRMCRNDDDRLQWRRELLALLRQRNYNTRAIHIIYNLIIKIFTNTDPLREEEFMEVIWKTTEEDERQIKEWAEWGLKNRLPSFVITEAMGIEKGIEKGREEGREEGKMLERQNMVMTLHAEGLQVEAIERITKLSLDEISRIIDSHNS